LITAAGGDVGPAVASVREYLQLRLTAEQRQALAALSLVTKIGYSGNVADELGSLCNVLSLDARHTLDSLYQLRRGPGFAVVAGRYFYVSPEIVAHVAFADAWDRWCSDDPHGFLARVPEPLLVAFLARIQRSASEEVRRICGDYFRGWAARLRPADLNDATIATRIEQLVETDPNQYLPASLATDHL
jgi:hypothetical protein